MRSEKILVDFLKKIVSVVYDECNSNPEFAKKIDQVLSEIHMPNKSSRSKKKQDEPVAEAIPELYNEWHARDEVDFAIWLLEHPVPVLHATIRSYELDARKQATKWKAAKKLSDFIVDKLRTKVTRGSSFIRTSNNIQNQNNDND